MLITEWRHAVVRVLVVLLSYKDQSMKSVSVKCFLALTES